MQLRSLGREKVTSRTWGAGKESLLKDVEGGAVEKVGIDGGIAAGIGTYTWKSQSGNFRLRSQPANEILHNFILLKEMRSSKFPRLPKWSRREGGQSCRG